MLSTELASLVARAADADDVVRVTRRRSHSGRVTLEALGASDALVTPIATSGSAESVLIASATEEKPFLGDALATMRAFAEQAAIALEQARLFAQLGERNEEIARQKDELIDRSDVIRDIVYALAHDLRTPLAAARRDDESGARRFLWRTAAALSRDPAARRWRQTTISAAWSKRSCSSPATNPEKTRSCANRSTRASC